MPRRRQECVSIVSILANMKFTSISKYKYVARRTEGPGVDEMGLEVGDVVPQVERVRPTKHLVAERPTIMQRKRNRRKKKKKRKRECLTGVDLNAEWRTGARTRRTISSLEAM